MIITQSNVNMASAREYSRVETESLRSETIELKDSRIGSLVNMDGDRITLSREGLENLRAQNMQQAAAWGATTGTTQTNAVAAALEPEQHELSLLKMMLEQLTGKKVHTTELKPINLNGGAVAAPVRLAQMNMTRVTRTTSMVETEKVSFKAAGQVQTADGRTIDFGISLNMSREFAEILSTETVDASAVFRDPLVINYGGNAASLAGQTFSFDLDSDGALDQISLLKDGSGFLAYDKNGDGTINDGGELFGTQSGNGFRDLAVYDSDGNGWIDEADDIYQKLSVWVKNDKGEDQLIALAAVGVGAIYLGSVSTLFAQKDAENNTLGLTQRTGVFLYESGLAGTVQHLDMKV